MWRTLRYTTVAVGLATVVYEVMIFTGLLETHATQSEQAFGTVALAACTVGVIISYACERRLK